MDILLVSDSHGRNDNIQTVLSRIGHLDMAIHLGDSQCYPQTMHALFPCPLHIVRGNCDFISDYPAVDVVGMGEHLALITHGHRCYVKHTLDDLRELARENGADIAIFGHTHMPLIDDSEPDVLVLNPGSIQQPRQEGYRPSYMFLAIDDASGKVEPRIVYL